MRVTVLSLLLFLAGAGVLSAQSAPLSCRAADDVKERLGRLQDPGTNARVAAIFAQHGLVEGAAPTNRACLEVLADLQVLEGELAGTPGPRREITCLRADLVGLDISRILHEQGTLVGQSRIGAIQAEAGMRVFGLNPDGVDTRETCEAAIFPLRNYRREVLGLAPLDPPAAPRPAPAAEPAPAPATDATPPATALAGTRFSLQRVSASGVIPLHAAPGKSSDVLGQIPAATTGLALGPDGCTPAPAPGFAAMDRAAQQRQLATRWCQILWDGRTGWVYGRFLKIND